MAITIAHPALAAPLRHFGLPLSPLVIGSMVPDFEFFIKLSPYRSISHTLPGIVLFCLPVGLSCLLVFDRFLKEPLLALLPDHHQAGFARKSGRYQFLPADQLVKTIAAMTLGIFTHFAWDSFTHDGGFGVRHLPLLAKPVARIAGHPMPAYFALQYVTSAIGIGALIVTYRKKIIQTLHDRIDSLRVPHLGRALSIAFISGYGFLGGLALGAPHIPGIQLSNIKSAEGFIAHTAVGSVTSVAVVLCAFAAFWHWTRRILKRSDG